jgi:hypothetical protein
MTSLDESVYRGRHVWHDGHSAFAMLVRRESETLVQLLIRLDLAIARAHTEDGFNDEISQFKHQ